MSMKAIGRRQIHGAILTALAGAMLGAAAAISGSAQAAGFDCPDILQISATQAGAHCTLGLNKSKVVELPRPAKDVLVSNPAIADAVLRANNRIYITGVAVGQASIFIFDRDNKLMINLELEVERDIGGLEATLNQLIPGSRIRLQLINDNIVLSGSVRNAADSRRAMDLADAFANGGRNSQAQQDRSKGSGAGGSGTTIVVGGAGDTETKQKSSLINLLVIEGEEQVALKVTVAEIQRNVIKQLGIDLTANLTAGSFASAVVSENAFPINSKLFGGSNGSAGIGDANNGISGVLRALEQTGVIRTLAEPTLTAISGESASFLAGGEFPVPTGRDSSGTISITYKPYGVGLAFTPVVLSEGRISIRVKTEVSEMSADGSLGSSGGGNSSRSIQLPSVRVRRAETTVEMPSGGSFVMAGLLQDDVRQALSGFPGLKDLPVLGTLFRSRDYLRKETELVIIITPYLVKPVARTALARPDDGFNASSDQSSILFGRLNRIYGVQGTPAPQGTYQGRFGFIYE